MFRAVSLVTLLALSPVACDDDEAPVDVPFQDIDVGGEEETPPPAPEPEPTAEETAEPTKPRPGPAARPRPSDTSRIQGCCTALWTASREAKKSGQRDMHRQAAQVCSRLMSKVLRGDISQTKALGQVRSSLLGDAPGACR